jgi:hypothetical protein
MPSAQPIDSQQLVVPQRGLQNAKKCARLLVHPDRQDETVEQLAVQLLQADPQREPQPKLQGSRQFSDRKPRRIASSRQGRGQHRPADGGGIAVQHVGAAVAHELQPPFDMKP